MPEAPSEGQGINACHFHAITATETDEINPVRRVFRLLITAIILTVVAAGAYLAYDRAMTPFSPPSLADYPIQGIDISHHQGDIDWARLKGQPNIRFVIMKATEGGDHRDRKFADNWRAAKDAGIIRGAYHFFTFCRPGAEQADNVLATIPADADALPLALDLEFTGNCGKVPTLDELSAELSAFYTRLGTRYPGRPLFYMNESFFEQYFAGNENRFPPHDLWIRSIAHRPDCSRWSLWQFADDGTVEGIEGAVDLNALCPESGLAPYFSGPSG